jgi:hypothetical protein
MQFAEYMLDGFDEDQSACCRGTPMQNPWRAAGKANYQRHSSLSETVLVVKWGLLLRLQ